MTKRVALAGIGLTLVVGVGFLWRALALRPGAVPPVFTSNSRPSDTPPSNEIEASDSANPVKGRSAAATVVGEAAVAGPTKAAKPEEPTIAIEGTVVVLDSARGEHPSEDGAFTLLMRAGDTQSQQRIAVTRGQWTTHVREDSRLSIGNMELGGRGTVYEEPYEPVSLPADHRVLLRARWPPGTLLHVKAADTGQELERIEILRGMSIGSIGVSCPGPYTSGSVLARSATSPIQLDEIDKVTLGVGSQPYFARSDRYAWARIDLDLVRGGEYEMLLKPGGALDVELSAQFDLPGAAEVCARLESAPTAEPEARRLVLGQQSIALDSLAEDRYLVTVELPSSESQSLVLGTATAVIVPGARTRVAIVLRETPKTATASLTGIVILPKEWNIEEFYLQAIQVPHSSSGRKVKDLMSRDMRHVEGKEDVRAFAWDAVPVGRYELIVDPPYWGTIVEVGASGLKDARVEVPSPSLVSVRLLDLTLGCDASIDELSWYPIPPEGVTGWRSSTARRDAGTGRFEFRAPRGGIAVDVYQVDYVQARKYLTIGSGRNDFTIELERACGISLELRDGGVSIPFDEPNVSIQKVDGARGWDQKSSSVHGLRFTLTSPGRYRIEIQPPSGYQPVEPIVVDVATGRFSELVVPLKRQP